MTREAASIDRNAPRLLRAFLLYILPALALSVGGIVFSIYHSIGIAIEAYQANLDAAVARQAFDGFARLGGDGIHPGNREVALDAATRDLLRHEGVNCLAFFRPDGTVLGFYRFDARCRPMAAETVSEVVESGEPAIIEGGMIPNDWTSIALVRGWGSEPDRLVALSRDSTVRESNIGVIARNWTLLFAGLFAVATVALMFLVARTQKVLDRAFSELARIERQLERFVSRSALAFVKVGDQKAKRSVATVIFADLTNFSGFAEKSDPEATAALIDRFVSVSAGAIERHSGDVDKLLGDGVLAWFEGPESIGNAMDAISDIIDGCAGLDRKPSFGLMHGEVVAVAVGQGARRDFTILGRTVNLASRLCSVAHESQVVMPFEAYSAWRCTAAVLERTTMTFKNHEEPLEVVRLDLRAGR